jgi:hypothetical protein
MALLCRQSSAGRQGIWPMLSPRMRNNGASRHAVVITP